MGIRKRAYWLRQAEAIRRRTIATMAHAIGLALTSGEDKGRALDDLELTKTHEDSLRDRSSATWGMLFAIGEGRGV